MIFKKLDKGFQIKTKNGSGWVTCYEDKDEINICFIEVKNELRNKGIGTMLIKEVIKIAKNKNIYLLAMATSPEITEKGLVNFYKKLGFKKIEKDNGTKGVDMIKINKKAIL